MNKIKFLAAVAVAAMLSFSVACEKNGEGNDESTPDETEDVLVGIWENTAQFAFIRKIKINGDGTAEVLYFMNDEYFDYVLSLEITGNEISLGGDIATWSLTEDNHLVINANGNRIDLVKSDVIEWNYGVSNIFEGIWESDDEYEKIYFKFDEIGFCSGRDYGLAWVNGNVYQVYHIQTSCLNSEYEIKRSVGCGLMLTKPVREGDVITCQVFDDHFTGSMEIPTIIKRKFKRIEAWPFDDIQNQV